MSDFDAEAARKGGEIVNRGRCREFTGLSVIVDSEGNVRDVVLKIGDDEQVLTFAEFRERFCKPSDGDR